MTVNNVAIESDTLDVRTETKKDKKPTKRSRKAINNSTESIAKVIENGSGDANADAEESVVPKSN